MRARSSVRRSAACARLLVAAAAISFALSAAQAAPLHPLDPLGADELAKVGAILKKSDAFSHNTDFSWISLDEPPKAIVSAFTPGGDFPRRAYVAAVDFDKKKAFDVIVDLKTQRIASVTDLQDLAPGLISSDDERAQNIIDEDQAIRQALTRRGFSIEGKISDALPIFFMPVGYDPAHSGEHARLIRALFGSDQRAANDFSPFLEGLMAVIDLYAGRVVKLYDNPGAPSLKVPHDIFDPAVRGSGRPAKQAERPRKNARTVKVERNIVAWHNWQFRLGFNVREGLVLYQVGFNSGGRKRPILYRAALSEVLTAYADANEFRSWMELFDEGVFGLGYLSIDVRPGREVPVNATMISPVMPDSSKPRFSDVFRDRIYIYERDGGGLMHYRQGDLNFHTRASELVVGFMASLGNYVYGFNWVFKQDGSFAFEAELAGEILTKFVADKDCGACRALAAGPGPDGASRTYTSGGEDRHGTLVHPNLVGISHQHWFNLRLDFDIDGAANAVLETNRQQTEDSSGADRFFTTARTVFGKAQDAKRDTSEETSRTWMIYNPSSVSAGGRQAGYTVMPVDSAATMFGAAREKDTVGFTFHQFWVTPYRDGELYASGWHPAQAGRDYADSLYHYANADPIYDRDIVVWYSLGETHVPRPEDYPIMSNAKISVMFRPEGFFAHNPALGLGNVYESK